MLQNFEKFINSIAKLNDYFILSKETEEAIVGTKVIVKDDQPFSNPIGFSPYNPKNNAYHEYKNKLPVFFLITASQKSALYKLFTDNKLPILFINNKEVLKDLSGAGNLIHDFVNKNFINKEDS